MSVKEYSWWGFDDNSPPEHLKTKRQLSVLGFKPGEPVGVIRTPDYNCYLYDPSTCPAKRPLTDKQKEAIARRKLLKDQAAWKRKRQLAYEDLKAYLYTISDRIQSLIEECNLGMANPLFSERFAKHQCDRIITVCRHAKEELKFLYPPSTPLDPDGECRAAVLGGQVPRDVDGQCRAAVLSPNQPSQQHPTHRN